MLSNPPIEAGKKPGLASGRSPDSRFFEAERLPEDPSVAGLFAPVQTLHAYSYWVVADSHRASRAPDISGL